MNNTFNPNRFLLLFKKHTIEHAKANLLSTIVLTGILFLALLFMMVMDGGRVSTSDQQQVFAMIMLSTGPIFTSLTFSNLGSNNQAIPMLTLPVSHLEKYLVAWIYSFIIFQLVFIGAFYLTDSVVIALGSPDSYHQKVGPVDVFNKYNAISKVFLFYAFLHGFAFWGAIFFKNMHFIKTGFVFFIGLLVLFFINKILISSMITIPPHQNGFDGMSPFNGLHFLYNGRGININTNNYVMPAIITPLIIVGLWASAFFRLKEKQV